jgi:hypothetical protein
LTLSSLDDDFTADDDAISLVTLWEKQFQSARSDSEPTPKAASMLRKVSQTPEEERKSSQHSSSTRTTDAMMSKKREKKFLKLGAYRSPQVAFRFLARSVSDDPSSYTKRKCEGEIEMVSLFVFIHQHAACVFMPFFSDISLLLYHFIRPDEEEGREIGFGSLALAFRTAFFAYNTVRAFK